MSACTLMAEREQTRSDYLFSRCKVTNNSAMVQEISELSERDFKKNGRVPEVSVCAQNGN